MADGPVGVVGERIDRADGEERALKRGDAVEHRGHHHEAQRRIVPHLVHAPFSVSRALRGRRPGSRRVAAERAERRYDPRAEVFRADPFAVYDELRRDAPVFWSDRMDGWIISRYEDVVGVLNTASASASHPVPRLEMRIGLETLAR